MPYNFSFDTFSPFRLGQSNKGPEPQPWDNENAHQEEVEEERVFYSRPPSPPPSPISQHHFDSREVSLP
jgi:hypothetical protein